MRTFFAIFLFLSTGIFFAGTAFDAEQDEMRHADASTMCTWDENIWVSGYWEEQCSNVWVSGSSVTECEDVWVPGYIDTQCNDVWVPGYMDTQCTTAPEWRQVCGMECASYTVCEDVEICYNCFGLEPWCLFPWDTRCYWETQCRTETECSWRCHWEVEMVTTCSNVWVPGYWDTQCTSTWVFGYWDEQCTTTTSPGSWELQCNDVLVPGYTETVTHSEACPAASTSCAGPSNPCQAVETTYTCGASGCVAQTNTVADDSCTAGLSAGEMCSGGSPVPSTTSNLEAAFVCNPASCEVYSSASGVLEILELVNESEGDGAIERSIWRIENDEGTEVWSSSCDNRCNLTVQPAVANIPGEYTVTLEVEDNLGLTDAVSGTITILEDIRADFMCSLDGIDWVSCDEMGLLMEAGTTVYFRDSTLLEKHSTPSAGASITGRAWRLNEETLPFIGPNASVFLRSGSNTITLIVTDNVPRTDSQSYQIYGTLPFPDWREVPAF